MRRELGQEPVPLLQGLIRQSTTLTGVLRQPMGGFLPKPGWVSTQAIFTAETMYRLHPNNPAPGPTRALKSSVITGGFSQIRDGSVRDGSSVTFLRRAFKSLLTSRCLLMILVSDRSCGLLLLREAPPCVTFPNDSPLRPTNEVRTLQKCPLARGPRI